MSDFEWDPATYLAQMLDEIPGYEELQAKVAAATEDLTATTVLELGTGTGETALRVLAKHPTASWTGIDASAAMLARARTRLPGADLRLARLEDPLPSGPFDLVVSVLAVHHLTGDAKRDLFTRIAQVSDNFVLGDVVVPESPQQATIEIDWEYDLPSSVASQLEWLDAAGFQADVTYVRPDLALFRCRRPG
jgi:tRNA (cmo5U34)-methyltransferase